MTPEQSVSSMIPVIESRGIQHSGTFWTWEGKVYWIRRSESTGDADTRCNSLIRGKTASILAEKGNGPNGRLALRHLTRAAE